jgi:hypothetical protein
MIDFFETKAFGATIVGALTTIVSLFSSTNAGAAIGLGLFIASAFLLIFEKTALSRSPPDVTSARRANPPGDLFGVTSDQRRKHSVKTAGSGGQAASLVALGFQFQGRSWSMR